MVGYVDSDWECRVDGDLVEIRSAYHTFMAVPIDPGVHTVRLAYENPLLDTDWRLMLVGVPAVLVILGAGAVLDRRRTGMQKV